MAVETQFSSENMDYYYYFSQNWMNPNNVKTSLPPIQQKHFLQQHMNMNMNMAMEMEMGVYNVVNQGITSYPSSSSSCTTTATATATLAESCLPSMAITQPFAALLEKHNHELDHFLHVQGERLKEALHQQKRQQLLLIASSYESKTMALLREKEESLEKLRVRTRLLEEYLKKAETESELWQSIAMKKEEMVIELNNMLLFAQQNNIINTNNNNNNCCYNSNKNDNAGAEDNDAESVCDGEAVNKMGCKWCKNGSMNVVLLPCKHLCCCQDCEALLELCPVCHSVKHGSLEVFFS